MTGWRCNPRDRSPEERSLKHRARRSHGHGLLAWPLLTCLVLTLKASGPGCAQPGPLVTTVPLLSLMSLHSTSYCVCSRNLGCHSPLSGGGCVLSRHAQRTPCCSLGAKWGSWVRQTVLAWFRNKCWGRERESGLQVLKSQHWGASLGLGQASAPRKDLLACQDSSEPAQVPGVCKVLMQEDAQSTLDERRTGKERERKGGRK